MQGKTSVYHQLLDEICREDGIDLAWLSTDWLAVMRKGQKERRVLGYGKFDLNPAAASMAADDKCVTFELLHQAKLPVVEYAILYAADNHDPYVHGRNSLEYVIKYFNEHNQHIVIKPNAGQCGMGISQITAPEQIPAALDEALTQGYAACMCPFYDIEHEYRVVMLDDEARLTYQKNRQDDWRFNLSKGATVSQLTDAELSQQLVQLAQQAAQAMGLRFCSVDIIKTTTGELRVIEVNSGVAIVHYLEQFPSDYTKVKAIYRDAIKKMFATCCEETYCGLPKTSCA